MKNLSQIKNQLTTTEQLQNLELIKGGAKTVYKSKRDDKRRQRPSGGTTTTSPSNVVTVFRYY
jgi:hypothetical protein